MAAVAVVALAILSNLSRTVFGFVVAGMGLAVVLMFFQRNIAQLPSGENSPSKTSESIIRNDSALLQVHKNEHNLMQKTISLQPFDNEKSTHDKTDILRDNKKTQVLDLEKPEFDLSIGNISNAEIQEHQELLKRMDIRSTEKQLILDSIRNIKF